MLILSKKKIQPSTCSYLRAFYRQATPNFAYSFIEFEEIFQPTYSYIFWNLDTFYFHNQPIEFISVFWLNNIWTLVIFESEKDRFEVLLSFETFDQSRVKFMSCHPYQLSGSYSAKYRRNLQKERWNPVMRIRFFPLAGSDFNPE